MRVLVTGAAGFVGSHLTERFLDEGHEVIGLDCFTPYYARALKELNLEVARAHKSFTLVEIDLKNASLERALEGVEVVVHLAAQAGVRSFGPQFSEYIENNLSATHRLLEAIKLSRTVRLLIFASSASVYGAVPVPMREDGPTRPTSPYGITKLAAEQLCIQYAAQHMVPAMCLRFFNVFGPRQRPDMAFSRLTVALLANRQFTLYGTGEQERDFTEVSDIVDAIVAASKRGRAGMVLNVGGGQRISLQQAMTTLERIHGRRINMRREPPVAGDMMRMEADTTLLKQELGFTPRVRLETGLQRQLAWVQAHLAEYTKQA